MWPSTLCLAAGGGMAMERSRLARKHCALHKPPAFGQYGNMPAERKELAAIKTTTRFYSRRRLQSDLSGAMCISDYEVVNVMR